MPPLVFFGSSAYSIPVLQTLLDHHLDLAVVTTPDQPAGRHLQLTPNPLKKFALEKGLTVATSPLTPLQDFGEGNQRGEVVGLVAAYGKIIPQSVLDKFNSQIYNIHPSLLPKYRGPSPLQQQILDGLTTTGVTIIQLDAQMDHGPIVARSEEPLLPTDTPETLGKRLFIKGAELFINLVGHLSLGELGKLEIQDDSAATYTKKLTRENGFVPYPEFQTQIQHPSPEFSRKFRAYFPWPGLWSTDPAGTRLKLTSLHPLRLSHN